jgi:hypothetical protein
MAAAVALAVSTSGAKEHWTATASQSVPRCFRMMAFSSGNIPVAWARRHAEMSRLTRVMVIRVVVENRRIALS